MSAGSPSARGADVPFVVVGAGIVGLATARALALAGRPPLVLEAEPDVARHQTGRNSGVIHSGLYYRPGSAKARTCVRGRELLERFCDEQGIERRRCGKLLVATSGEDEARLDGLIATGTANGLDGLRRLDAAGLREHEPDVAGRAGLFVPQTGVVDFAAVARALVREIEDAGGSVRTGSGFVGLERRGGRMTISYRGGEVVASGLVNCAGLQSDRVARACGIEPGLRIVPFRGEYLRLSDRAAALVRGLIYPVPDPRFPFLGVHLTRRIDDRVDAGPNALLALSRGRYGRFAFTPRDAWSTLSYPGFWRMARRWLPTAAGELRRAVSRRAAAAAIRELVPDVRAEDLGPGGAGTRAQALAPDGSLLDDFRIVERDAMVHVLNAPSPAATASLAIGEQIAGLALARATGERSSTIIPR